MSSREGGGARSERERRVVGSAVQLGGASEGRSGGEPGLRAVGGAVQLDSASEERGRGEPERRVVGSAVQLGGASEGRSGGEPGLRAVGGAVQLGGTSEERVVVEPLSGRVRVVSGQQGGVLGAVRGEHTAVVHAEQVARRIGAPPAQVRSLVEALVLKGLLVEWGQVAARVSDARRHRERAAISMLGIPTRAVTPFVVRCVKEHAEAMRAR